MNYVFDSSAFIAYLFREQEGQRVFDIFKSVKRGKCFMSVIQVGEVLYIVEKERGKKAGRCAMQAIGSCGVQIVDIDVDQAIIASRLKAKGGIAYPDCFALALAAKTKGTLVTKDKEFKKYENDVKIEWLS